MTTRTVRLVLLTWTILFLARAGFGQPSPTALTTPTTKERQAVPSAVAPHATLPVARKTDVVEERFGVKVVDPYRWMEGAKNPELEGWLRAQGAYTTTFLAGVPGRTKLFERVRHLASDTSTASSMQLAGGRAFYLALAAGEQLPKLSVRDADAKMKVLVDPAALGGKDTHASLNSYAPSPDGARVAYNLSTGGSEVCAIHVIDVDSGKQLPDVVERIWGEFPAEWLPDGKGFFYTQMAAPASGADPMLNMKVRLHVLGEPVEKDVLILEGGDSQTMKIAPDEFPGVSASPDSRWLVASAGGAHSNSRFAVAAIADLDRSGSAKTAWRPVANYDDDVEAAVVHGGRLYLLTYKGASNRRLVSVPLENPDLAKARVEIAEDPNATIDTIAPARDALYVRKMANGRAQLWRLAWKAKTAAALALPADGWIDDLATDALRDGASFDLTTWTRPGTYFAYGPETKQVRAIGIGSTSVADFSQIAAEEVEAVSPDGAHVPLSILHRKDLVLDGSHPAILHGYGAYGISATPFFRPSFLAWLERGGVLAVAHVRGGGEKGERWHVDGSHEKKMNGIRDFIACGEYLVARKLTTPSRLFAQGGSAGGVLVGRAITERPDLFAGAHIAVGMVNPLRLLAAENGANQKMEFGDPDAEAGFKSILEVDPYQHVAPRGAYPAVVFTIGLNDRRVAPWMTAKMAARLQAATESGKPVLIRIDPDAGHGMGSTRDQAVAQIADVWAFFLRVAGDPEFAAK